MGWTPGAKTLVFAHANGFPAGTYRQLFAAWQQAGWQVLAPPRLGHEPAFPVRSNWQPSRDELIAFIERHAPGQRAHLVGHSLGGMLSLMAACRRPDLAASVVMLDSPVVLGWRAGTVRLAKAVGLMDRLSPAQLSRRRRTQWPSREEAREQLGGKRLFMRWHPGVFDDYLEAGLEDAPDGGVQLAFQRDIETAFYRTLPHQLGSMLRRHPPRCPVGFIGGTRSAEIRQAGLAGTQQVAGARMRWIEGTHLFPMERPEETAHAVLQMLAQPG